MGSSFSIFLTEKTTQTKIAVDFKDLKNTFTINKKKLQNINNEYDTN